MNFVGLFIQLCALRTGKSYFDYFEGYKCGNMFGAITLFP